MTLTKRVIWALGVIAVAAGLVCLILLYVDKGDGLMRNVWRNMALVFVVTSALYIVAALFRVR